MDRPTRVLVVYPRGSRTGGPEALHQLVDSLRRHGLEAWLWPVPDSRENQRVDDYVRYDAPEVLDLLDEPDTAVVFPEVYSFVPQLWQRASLYCWWLSIDNDPLYFSRRRRSKNAMMDSGRPSLEVVRSALSSQARLLRDRPMLLRQTHLAQSKYAWDYIRRRLWTTVTVLGDYIPDAAPRLVHKSAAPPSVAFNPAKGGDLIAQIQQTTNLASTWVPIKGLTRQGVRELLDQTTVYLEAGHQPGKDRIPREAALHGNVVLMLRRGAGANDLDCPIPEQHKIRPGRGAARRFADALEDVLADPSRHRALQGQYVNMIVDDQAAFDAAVVGIFREGQRGIKDWHQRALASEV